MIGIKLVDRVKVTFALDELYLFDGDVNNCRWF